MTSSGASYLCLPATNPNRIQPESSGPTPAPIAGHYSHTHAAQAEAQHKKSHSCLELLLLLLLLLLPLLLLLLQLGVGCCSCCCLRFCELIWQAAAPGTKALQLQHVRTHRPKLKLFQTNSVSKGRRGAWGENSLAAI